MDITSPEFYTIAFVIAMALVALLMGRTEKKPPSTYIVQLLTAPEEEEREDAVRVEVLDDGKVHIERTGFTLGLDETVNLVFTIRDGECTIVEKKGRKPPHQVSCALREPAHQHLGLICPGCLVAGCQAGNVKLLKSHAVSQFRARRYNLTGCVTLNYYITIKRIMTMKKILLLLALALSLNVVAQNAVGDWNIHTSFVGDQVTNVIETKRFVYYLSGSRIPELDERSERHGYFPVVL